MAVACCPECLRPVKTESASGPLVSHLDSAGDACRGSGVLPGDFSVRCPLCKKTVSIKPSTRLLRDHVSQEGKDCRGSGSSLESLSSLARKSSKAKGRTGSSWQESMLAARRTRETEVPAHAREQREEHAHDGQCTCSPVETPSPKKPRVPKGKGGSVRTVSGGLPGLGKRR